MNIIIPMAGMGKRMRPHTLTTAKPLIPIAGKPIVQRLVEDIIHTSNEKVEHIAYITSPHFSKETEEMLLNVASGLGATGHICHQNEALGTAHAILCAEEYLNGNVFIAFADTLFKATFSIDTQKDAIIWTQKVEDPSAFGVVKMNKEGIITDFVEKPKEFVSDLAIIGVYYFKDGDNLKKELKYLIDNNIQDKGEYQLTTAMENMKSKGLKFYSDQVEEWLDCGNKDATVYTNNRILNIKNGTEKFIDESATIENTTIISPVFIGAGCTITDSVIGPNVSIEANCSINGSIIKNSMVLSDSSLTEMNIKDSMIGKSVKLKGTLQVLNLGDFSTQA